jgi:hypothetical protein
VATAAVVLTTMGEIVEMEAGTVAGIEQFDQK